MLSKRRLQISKSVEKVWRDGRPTLCKMLLTRSCVMWSCMNWVMQ